MDKARSLTPRKASAGLKMPLPRDERSDSSGLRPRAIRLTSARPTRSSKLTWKAGWDEKAFGQAEYTGQGRAGRKYLTVDPDPGTAGNLPETR